MLSLIAALTVAPIAPTTAPDPVRKPERSAQVLITLNGADYDPGDRVKVGVSPSEDGYLIVFRVDGDGYVRVLFPIDPDLDQFVRGGSQYELRGRGHDESFLADDRGGTGLIFAALAREPLSVHDYAEGMHWDYSRLRLSDPFGDVEAQLHGIVRNMTDNGSFDYDAIGYRVWGPGFEPEPTVVVANGGYSEPYYDPYFSCLACDWNRRTGISISIGNNWGWRDPWYDPFYDPWNNWGYGSNYNRWNGWFGWDSYWGTPWRPNIVINTPRRPVVPNPVTGLRSRPRQPALSVPSAGRSGTGLRTTTGGRQATPGRTTQAPGRATRTPGRTTQTPAPSSTRSRSRPATKPATRPATQPATRSTGSGATRSATPAKSPALPPSSTRSRTKATRKPVDDLKSGPNKAITSVPAPTREMPVYRPPSTTERTSRTATPRKTVSRPSSSPPPRTTSRSSSPPKTVSRPTTTRSSSPPKTVSRPSTSRSSSPPKTVSRPSASKSSPPAKQSSSRSRKRPDS